jgi:hypothetical protein
VGAPRGIDREGELVMRYVVVCAAVALALMIGGTAGAQTPADARAAQLARLQTLLRDQGFALEMAQFLDAAYYRGIGQAVPPFLKPEEDTATAAKSVREEKIAINLAGFYALEAGIGYLSERDGLEPVKILEAIAEGRLAKDDMLLLARFANATWKASQPFRSLSRISRDTFRPAALLSADELAKDYVQVNTAAAKLLEAMKR